jgi:hypothetical protein
MPSDVYLDGGELSGSLNSGNRPDDACGLATNFDRHHVSCSEE